MTGDEGEATIVAVLHWVVSRAAIVLWALGLVALLTEFRSVGLAVVTGAVMAHTAAISLGASRLSVKPSRT